MLNDLRFALRTLRKNPGFTAATVVTLALGIGANTAIFSVVNGVLLRPLPFPEPGRILALWQNDLGDGIVKNTVSMPNFLDWRDQNTVFAAMAAYGLDAVTIAGPTAPVRVRIANVSEGFFDVMGIAPLLGRSFGPEDHRPGVPPAIVLSRATWQASFGADPTVVGRQIRLDGQSATIVGVMPEGFSFPRNVGGWKPRTIDPATMPGRGLVYLQVVGRLKPGVTLPEARAEMTAIAGRLEREYPEANPGVGITMLPLQEDLVGDVRTPLLVLLGAVACVLLIACGNVANLLLARGVGRQREVAVRVALGAARWRVVRQFFAENLLLAALGGLAGLLAGLWSFAALTSLLPADLPRADDVRLDGTVLAFTVAVSMLAGLVFGLLPALNASRADLADALRERVVAGAGRRLRNGLVVAEMALAMTLLVGAGLLVVSFTRLQAVPPGFDPSRVLASSIVLPSSRYATPDSEIAFYRRVLDELRAIPGMESVGAVTTLPLQGSELALSFAIEGRPEPTPDDTPDASFDAVTADYFRTLRIPILAGRAFTPADDRDAPPVVMVSESLARRYWPGEDVVGRRIRVDWGDDPPFREIVGVVADVHHAELGTAPAPTMYTPIAQVPFRFAYLVARTAGDPAALSGAVRTAIGRVDPDLAPGTVAPFERTVSASVAQPRFRSRLVAGFAALALLLAVIGLSGVLSYSVAQRRGEIGVRMALGARSSEILRLVLREGLALASAGVALGAVGAVTLRNTLDSLLFGVSAVDARIYLGLAALLTAVALVAAYLPARRAARVDPVTALRAE